LWYDVDPGIDLALVIIAPPCPVRAVPIAPEGYQIQPAQQVLSVGCDGGSNPTVRTHQIISVDRIHTSQESRTPFHYVQVSGAPVGGRSGGGLFSSEGYLIGVCNTADPVVNDGHFVPPHIIRHVLDSLRLEYVYQNPSLGEPARAVSPPPALAALTPLAPLAPIETMASVPPMVTAAVPAPMVAENRGGMSLEEQATLEEIYRRKQDGDEVIVIIRPRRNPESPSDIITMKGTSDGFVNTLVNSPIQPANPAYNPVIFSSHGTEQSTRQPVSYPVKY
jgi:hypothetical protein